MKIKTIQSVKTYPEKPLFSFKAGFLSLISRDSKIILLFAWWHLLICEKSKVAAHGTPESEDVRWISLRTAAQS